MKKNRWINCDAGCIWLVICIFLFLCLQLPLRNYIVDDAFIHLTFAKNVASGYGFSFNPNEPTYGITAPLWTFLSVLISPVIPIGELQLKLLSILFGLLSIIAFRTLALRIGLSGKLSIIATLIWAINVWMIRWAASGMETTLAVLLIILSFNSLFGKGYTASLWLGLAILSRPEAAMFVPVIMIDIVLRRKWHLAIVNVLMLFVILIPWQIYAFYSFGSILPNTALVKGELGLPLFTDVLAALVRTVKIIGAAYLVEFIVIAISCIIIIREASKRRIELRTVLILAVWGLIPVVFYVFKGVFVTSRYLLIGFPPITLIAFMMFKTISDRLTTTLFKILGYGIISIVVLQHFVLFNYVTIPHIKAFMPTIEALKQMAHEIKMNTPDDSVVAVGDVGVIGFLADRRVIDLEGLVSHEIIPIRSGLTLKEFIFSGTYLKCEKVDYIIDKSIHPYRLERIAEPRYTVLKSINVPGGLVDTSHEKWYYTLYKVDLNSRLHGKRDARL